MAKYALLTGGGDCPGLNAVIRAATRRFVNADHEVLGIIDGWKGMIEANAMELTIENTDAILPMGGTIVGTSRTNPYKNEERDVPKVLDTFKKLGIECLVAVGGDDTLGVARRLHDDHDAHVVGAPKTIDNDLSCTDYTFGFDTAINIAMEAIDRLHTTAKSHHRCLVVEAMGRHAGWIAMYAGLAGSADFILVPERQVDLDEMIGALKRNRARGRNYNIVVVSEGAKLGDEETLKHAKKDEFGHVYLGGVGERLAKYIEEKTGYETRSVVLGHIQRGGSPTAFDRILGTRFGLKAADIAMKKEYGKMVALRGTEIAAVSLSEATGELKTVPLEHFAEAEEFF
jgi:6-phosphofructokinase 1